MTHVNLICLDAKFALVSVFTLIGTICLKMLAKPPPKIAKSLPPVDVRCQKRLCLSSLSFRERGSWTRHVKPKCKVNTTEV